MTANKRHKWIEDVLPLSLSVSAHSAVVIVALVTFVAVKSVATTRPVTAVPVTSFDGPTGASVRAVSITGPTGLPRSFADPVNLAPTLPGVDGGVAPVPMAAPGLGNSPFPSGGGPAGVAGHGGGPFNLPRGGGSRGNDGIFTRQNLPRAESVVYLCDASGSMAGVFGRLKAEMKTSISSLTVDQTFDVIFFSDGKPVELFPGGLKHATPAMKASAVEFIDDAVATGGTEPTPAIRRALSQKPRVLYVMTDGFDNVADYNDVIKTFTAGNAGRGTQVNCILLQASDDPKLKVVLKTIADQNGGRLTVISKDEF